MVLFGSLLDQFVSSFDRANGLSIFQFDAVRFMTFQQKILIDGFNGSGTVVLSLISQKSKIKIHVGVDAIVVSISSFETRCSISASSPVQ